MTINQTFNYHRFKLTLKKEVVENYRNLGLMTLVLYGCLSLLFIFGNLIDNPGTLAEMGDDGRKAAIFMIYSVGLPISTSLMFSGLKDKAGRIGFIMTPSSTLEKYLANIAVYVIGFSIAFVVCVYLADATRWAVLSLMRFHYVPGLVSLNMVPSISANFYNMPPSQWQSALMCALFVVNGLCNVAVFACGAVLWPRLSCIKTFAVVYAVSVVMSILVMVFTVVLTNADFSWFAFADSLNNGATWLLSALLAISTIVTVVFFWLSYHMLRRKDVVKTSWV